MPSIIAADLPVVVFPGDLKIFPAIFTIALIRCADAAAGLRRPAAGKRGLS
jgi:hypothetical protein